MEDTADTRRALLDAATVLFAEQGFDGTSLRNITERAGTNIASVNYHFGSKDGLITAVLTDLIGPVNQERLARLDALNDDAPLEAVLRAFIEPVFGALTDPAHAKVCLSLAARLHMDPERGHKMMVEQFRPVIESFHARFVAVLPAIPPITVFWRLHMIIGGALHVLQAHNGGKLMSEHLGQLDPAAMLHTAREELVAFALAGLNGTAPGQES
ncbi:MAG: TetR/AcrR family transcriptional regulator [Planctomycetota bacterium]|nr:TetR/AcrR family transcriptional regulator [Planctomycetota bacterium]